MPPMPVPVAELSVLCRTSRGSTALEVEEEEVAEEVVVVRVGEEGASKREERSSAEPRVLVAVMKETGVETVDGDATAEASSALMRLWYWSAWV